MSIHLLQTIGFKAKVSTLFECCFRQFSLTPHVRVTNRPSVHFLWCESSRRVQSYLSTIKIKRT